MIREKKTVSGPLLEADFYPVWTSGVKMPTRAPKSKPTCKEQKKYNELVSTKTLIRLVNHNFHKVDYFAHLTYRAKEAPQDEKRARADINNFLRRVKRRREKELEIARRQLRDAKAALASLKVNAWIEDTVKRLTHTVKLLRRPLRYIYVLEKKTYQSGVYAGRTNWHFHMFASGGLSAALMEDLWSVGTARFNNYRPDTFGPDAAASYMAKDPQGSKRFVCSRTIKKPPKPKTKDGGVTRRQVERMAKERVDDREYWEKRYKGYRFLKCYARPNPFNGHWYISVVMYKTGGGDPPEWRYAEWLTEDGAG